MKVKVRYTQNEMKHSDGLTFVAHRPLFGLDVWYRDDRISIFGRHFVWIPDDAEACGGKREEWISRNIAMNARLLKHVADDEIKDWYRKHSWFIDKINEGMIESHFDCVCEYFYLKNNDKEIEIE